MRYESATGTCLTTQDSERICYESATGTCLTTQDSKKDMLWVCYRHLPNDPR